MSENSVKTNLEQLRQQQLGYLFGPQAIGTHQQATSQQQKLATQVSTVKK